MPKPLPTVDPRAFAERLLSALDAFDEIPRDRGRGKALAERYQAAGPTVSAWLKGEHMPSPDRVLAMAEDMDQDFMWLYFGKGTKNGAESRAAPASHSERPTPDNLQDAMGLLDEIDGIYGRKPSLRPHPARLAIALKIVTEGEVVGAKSNVVRLADRLREWEQQNGDEQRKASGTGARNGVAHGAAGTRKATAKAGRR